MRLSVIQPIDEALRRTKELLFAPFDAGRWLGLTTSLFLAMIALNVQIVQTWVTEAARVLRVGREEELAGAAERGLRELQPHAMTGVLLAVLILWVIMWVGTRGVFMFLDDVVRGRGEVVGPWKRYRAHGNSLTRMRFVWTLAIGVALGMLVMMWVGPLVRRLREAGIGDVGVWQAVGAVGVMVAVASVGAVVDHLLTEFVAPIMYLHNVRAWPAWWYFLNKVLLAHVGSFVLFYVVSALLWLAAMALVAVLSLASCCGCCCALGVPYVNMLVLLPVFTFFRYYSVCFLAQCGPACDVLRLAAPATGEQQ